MIYEDEFTDEFESWWTQFLSEAEQDEVAAKEKSNGKVIRTITQQVIAGTA